MKKVEILAPAGSIEALYAALKMGADAVYVGTDRFGARAFADNPSVEEITDALFYAHLRNKKIYLTVNTLLTDREIEKELYSVIRPLYEAGLDACIVQDVGVLSFLHENFPDMDLHASTQMTLFSGEEANLLKPYGVTRYVPAREMTIEEIREAKKQTDMEIEVFVHGALCYCYSGQCLMSEVIGGRSGNRGRCAQPCRLPYRTEYGNGHLLSTKDICTLMYIPEMVEAGIDSFKIEGRMKKKEYSAYLSQLYRKYTDIYLREGKQTFERLRENAGSELWKDYRNSQDLYNRGGFSDSFLFEADKKKIVYTEKNGHYGTLAGTVTEVSEKKAVFTAEERIRYQDVLEFRDEDGSKAYEYTVKKAARTGDTVSANILPGSHIYEGQSVYRTKNTGLLKRISRQIDGARDLYAVKASLCAKQGEKVCLTIRGKGISVATEGVTVQPASSRPVTVEDIRKSINCFGGTGYVLAKLEISLAPDSFIPIGKLKELRRQAVQNWEEQAVNRREAPAKPNVYKYGKAAGEPEKQNKRKWWDRKKDSVNIVSVASCAQLRTAVSEAGENSVFHLKLEDILPEDWEEAAGLLKEKRVALSFPRILHGEGRKSFEREWEKYGKALRELSVEAVIINSFVMYLYARKWWSEADWYADENLYEKNRRAGEFYRSLGIQPAPVREYGRIPVMVTKSCVANTLGRCREGEQRIPIETPKGDEFVVVNHCRYCYNTIYAAEPVRQKGKGSRKRLDFTLENEDEVRKVIREWNF